MLAIALIVLGIVFLCKKRIPYGKHRELRGPLAVLVCLMFIIAPVIFLGWGVMIGLEAGKNGRELDEDKIIEITLHYELPTYGGILLLSWLIVATNATPVRRRRRRRSEDDYDDFDDRRDDRRRRSRYDERDDDRDDRREIDERRERDDDYHERPRRPRYDDDFDDRRRDRRRDDY